MKKLLLKTLCVMFVAFAVPRLTVQAQQDIYVSGGGDIQAGINAVNLGGTVHLAAGVYNLAEPIVVDKSVTIKGTEDFTNPMVTSSIITGVGDVSSKALIVINSPNVTIEGLLIQVAQTGNSMTGISTHTNDNFGGLTIHNNFIIGTATQIPLTPNYTFDSYAIKLGAHGLTGKHQVAVTKNTIAYSDMAAPQLFGRGLYAYNIYGKIGGQTVDKNNITAAYALQGIQIGGNLANQDFEFSHNNVDGLVSVLSATAGNHKINNNLIGENITDFSVAQYASRLVEVKGNRTVGANIEISNNTIKNYANVGVFVQRSNNVSIKNNIFTPFQHASNTSFSSVAFSSKEGTAGAQSAVSSENLIITGNTFNGNGNNENGVGVTFFNHNASVSIQPLNNAKIGGAGADKNNFGAQLANYLLLVPFFGAPTTEDASPPNGFYTKLYDIPQVGPNVTSVLHFQSDIDAAYNIFGGVDSETATVDQISDIKNKIIDKDKEGNAALGSVIVVPVVLPVALLSFTATAATGGALVKWSTAKEENNARFEVEKSFDGKSFFTVDSRKGQGNSATTSSYEFLDVSFKQSAYYRLVQVDVSGKSTTYKDLTKFVKGLDNSLSVVAYPNPVTTKLYVTVGDVNKESVKVLLSDLTGKTLKVKTTDNSQQIELDVAGIATGSYILQVIKNSGNVSKKILKL